jgi:hypothetical protein
MRVRAYGLPFALAREGRSSFLKKRSKRLLLLGVEARRVKYAKRQKFFGSFFQKRTDFLSPAAPPATA